MEISVGGKYGIPNISRVCKKWNVSQRRVAIYCKEGRIKGAVLKGRMWMIPADAKKPGDPRKAHKAE